MVSLIVLPCLRDPRGAVLQRCDGLPALREFFRAERLVLRGPERQMLRNVFRSSPARIRCSRWRSLLRCSQFRNRKRAFAKGTPHARLVRGRYCPRNVPVLRRLSSVRELWPVRRAPRNQFVVRDEGAVVRVGTRIELLFGFPLVERRPKSLAHRPEPHHLRQDLRRASPQDWDCLALTLRESPARFRHTRAWRRA